MPDFSLPFWPPLNADRTSPCPCKFLTSTLGLLFLSPSSLSPVAADNSHCLPQKALPPFPDGLWETRPPPFPLTCLLSPLLSPDLFSFHSAFSSQASSPIPLALLSVWPPLPSASPGYTCLLSARVLALHLYLAQIHRTRIHSRSSSPDLLHPQPHSISLWKLHHSPFCSSQKPEALPESFILCHQALLISLPR